MKELQAPFKNSGMNITMDNYFTTLPVAKHLTIMEIDYDRYTEAK